MPLFDAPKMTQFPRRWSDYSFDYKIFYIWQISLFAAIVFSTNGIFDGLSDEIFYGVPFLWFLTLIFVSLINRRRANWHWPRLTAVNVLKALGSLILAAIFLYVFAQGLLPLSHRTAAMILFAFSIGLFGVLFALELVQISESEFKRHCGNEFPASSELKGSSATEQAAIDPAWKRAIRGAYSVLFVLVWLEGVAFFYFHERYVHEGTLKPTATRTEFVNEHGTLVYLTHEQKRIDDLLLTIMMGGIPAILLSGFLLHYVAGIRIFPNGGPFRRNFGNKDM